MNNETKQTFVLVIVAHGVPCMLYIGSTDGESHDPIHEHIKSVGDVPCLEDVFDDLVPDGLWVIGLALVDGGPGDAPGSRECALKVTERRGPTSEEWRSYADNEHVWGIPAPEDF